MTTEQKAAELYRNGWDKNGEWKCSRCNTMIGKNLNGERPFRLAMMHSKLCKENPK